MDNIFSPSKFSFNVFTLKNEFPEGGHKTLKFKISIIKKLFCYACSQRIPQYIFVIFENFRPFCVRKSIVKISKSVIR